MSDKHWILLLVILIAVYFALEEKSYPIPPQTPYIPPQPRPKPELEKQIIWVTFIHLNGSSTSTGFPMEVINGENRVTIDHKRLL